jgi:hypothetical protein
MFSGLWGELLNLLCAVYHRMWATEYDIPHRIVLVPKQRFDTRVMNRILARCTKLAAAKGSNVTPAGTESAAAMWSHNLSGRATRRNTKGSVHQYKNSSANFSRFGPCLDIVGSVKAGRCHTVYFVLFAGLHLVATNVMASKRGM